MTPPKSQCKRLSGINPIRVVFFQNKASVWLCQPAMLCAALICEVGERLSGDLSRGSEAGVGGHVERVWPPPRCSLERLFLLKNSLMPWSQMPHLTLSVQQTCWGADFGWEYQEGFLSVGLTSDWHQDQAQGS